MSYPVRLLRLGRVSWKTSQAVYHAVAECMDEAESDTVILSVPNEPYVCAGFHQNPRDIFDVEYIRSRCLGILRRKVGGGAVYLDSDQVFFNCVFHHSRSPARVDELFQTMLGPAVSALQFLGFPAELQGVNEITLGGRRISGTGAGRIGEASVVVGNILRDFPYEEMVRVWRLPSEAFRHLAAEGIREHVTSLRRESADPPSEELIEKALSVAYERAFERSFVEGSLTQREEDAIVRLEEELTAPAWLEGHSGAPPAARLKIARGVYVCETHYESRRGKVALTARFKGESIEALVVRGPNEREEYCPGNSVNRAGELASDFGLGGDQNDFDAALKELTTNTGGDD